MIRRPRLLLFALFCLTPVLLDVTTRYDDNVWLVPAGALPLLLLGPTRITLWSLLTAAAFWAGLRWFSVRVGEVEWRARWLTVRGLALLSLIGVGLVVGSFTMVTLQWGMIALSWVGAAAAAWTLYLLALTRDLATPPPGVVGLLRLWLGALLLPTFFTFLYGTLAGLCC